MCVDAQGMSDIEPVSRVCVCADDEVSPMLLPVDKDARETADLRCASDPHGTARRICLGPVRTNLCAPSLVSSLSRSSLDLDIVDKADQALDRLFDSLETNASGNTPDSALSDRDTLHGTMRNNPVEFSGDFEEESEGANLAEEERLSKEAARTKAKEEEAARAKAESARKKAADPKPVIVGEHTEKATCRAPAVAGNAMTGDNESQKARLPEMTCAEEAGQRRKEGGVDEEGETIDVELYNKAKEELMLARKTVEDNATEIENLKLQLEHMKGFLTNLTVIG